MIPLRSTVHDIGPVLTHRTQIVRLALEGKTTSQICRILHHCPQAVAVCDLAELLGTGDSSVAHLLAAYERRQNTVVPRRATLHDVGTARTHKRIVCHKRYREGKPAHLVAKETYHSLEAVDRYLAQYDRVRHGRLQGLSPIETAHLLDCSLSLVEEYLQIDRELEPNDA